MWWCLRPVGCPRLVRRMLDLSRLNALTETVTAQEQFDITEIMSRVLVSLEGRITGPGPGRGMPSSRRTRSWYGATRTR